MRPAASLLLALLLLTALPAAAAPPSEESLERLLVLLRMPHQLEPVYQQMDQAFDKGMAMSLANSGAKLDEQQKQQVAELRASVLALMRQELSWENIKPVFLQTYREIFNQEEVDAMTAFYASEIGQQVIEKEPLAMRKSGQLMEGRLAGMQAKVMDAVKRALSGAGKPRQNPD